MAGGVLQYRQVFLGLPTLVELVPETVIGQTETRGRKQVVAVNIVGECPGLTHQGIDDVPVMHRVFIPTDQPRQRLGQRVRIPDLDTLGVQPGFHPLSDQTAVHRVGAPLNVDQTPRIDPATHLQATGQTSLRQTLQGRDLFGKTIAAAGIAAGHDPLKKLHIRHAAGEVPAASQQQGLIDGGLEMVMG